MLAHLAALMLSATSVNPLTTERTPPFPRVSVQVDPVLFGLRGYSIWVGLAVAPHWNITIGSFAGDALWQPEGWSARIRFSPIILTSYFFREDNRGPYLSMGFGQLQWGLEHQDDPGVTAEMDQVVLTPMVGFRWFPSPTLGLFIDPFASVAVPLFQTGSTTLQGKRYRQPLTNFLLPGFFVGWEF